MEMQHLLPHSQPTLAGKKSDAMLDIDLETTPVTPVNQNFPLDLDPTFATAIVSPSSNEVFAARTRARSRSEACLYGSNTANGYDPSPLMAITGRKRGSFQGLDKCADSSTEQDCSGAEDSLRGQLDESMDISALCEQEPSLTFSETVGDIKLDSSPDTSIETCTPHAHGEKKTESASIVVVTTHNAVTSPTPVKNAIRNIVPLQSPTHLMAPSLHRMPLLARRRKSNTISVPMLKTPAFQDVFGPRLPLFGSGTESAPSKGKEVEKDASVIVLDLGASSPFRDRRISQPRRMTVGAPDSSAYMHSTHERHRSRPSLRSIAEAPPAPKSPKTAERPIEDREPIKDVFVDEGVKEAAPVTRDDSIVAFQKLIQSMSKDRAIHSAALEEVKMANENGVGAVMEYQRTSPTSTPSKKATQSCDLCGSLARRLTVLEPCGHFACAACCSSGLNQVTATPPRAHVCAACHEPVQGITLYKGGDPVAATPRYIAVDGYHSSQKRQKGNRRPRTPSSDEQHHFFSGGRLPSSPMAAWSQRSDANVKTITSTSSSIMTKRRSSSDGSVALTDLTDSSEFAMDDAAFFAGPTTLGAITASIGTLSLSVPSDGSSSTEASGQDNVGLAYNKPVLPTVVVRLDNIPWTVTYQDVVSWLPAAAKDLLPDANEVAQAIHIPVDILSGKTANCCFVECRNRAQAMRLVRHRNNSRLLGRPVTLILTTYDDLLSEIFPFRAFSPVKDDEHCIFFTPGLMAQMVGLLTQRTSQLKGPSKVVDLATSMVRLVPATLSSKLRDLLFLRVKDIVCTCIMASREMDDLHESLNRLLLANSNCACFTVAQRIEVLDSAKKALNAVSISAPPQAQQSAEHGHSDEHD